jgi:hypothetical protein
MKTMRNLLLIAAITLLWFTACNYTVGECWYRDQGSEAAGAGAGAGGPILPPNPTGGDKGFGDVPPREPQGAPNPPPKPPACNEGEDDAIELGEVHCGKVEWGVDCMIRCGQEGVACQPQKKHPYMPEVGIGLLWKCCGCQGKQHCKYIYNNGDQCTYYGWPRPPLCAYIGGQ